VGLIDRAETSGEHIAVLDAALEGDWEGAACAMEKHLVQSNERANAVLEKIKLGD
jgi:DNA-binding FadR family transcriptional regulator